MTRYYLQQDVTPDITPTQKGTWDNVTETVRKVLSPTKSGPIYEYSVQVGSVAANYKKQLFRFISNAIAEDATITLNNYCIGLRENPADTDCYTRMHAYVTQGNSTTLVRGTLVDNWQGSVEWGVTAGVQGRAETPTNSSVEALAGDRIVVEIGYSASAENTAYTGKITHGGTDATDLSSGADERAYPGWIDFTIEATGEDLLKIINETVNISESKNWLRNRTKVISEVVNIIEAKNWYRSRIKVINEIIHISGGGTWPGLGMYITQIAGDPDEYDDWIDTLLANGIDEFREIANYYTAGQIAQLQGNITRNSGKGAKFIYGVSCNTFDHPETPITAENKENFRTAIKAQAQWAQDHNVFEFQVGNEEEWHWYYRCATGKLVRVGNTVTVTTPYTHGFDGTHQVTVFGNINPIFIGTFDIAIVDSTHFTYTTATSGDATNTATAYVGTLSQAQVIEFLKSVATECQSIFTNGNISYSCGHSFIGDWVTAGRGDIDLLASNIYMGGGGEPIEWEDEIDVLVAGFGVDHTYLTEFAPDSVSLPSYSEDEAMQAAGVTEMIDYIKASGMTRAIFFMWKHPTVEWGVLRTSDGGYRQLWDSLIGNQETVYTLIGGIIKIINEVLNISETKNWLRSRVKVVNETLNISELKNKLQAKLRIINETVSLIETVVKARGITKVINEVINLVEIVVQPFKRIFMVINETMHISEAKIGIKRALYKITAITIKCGTAVTDKLKLRRIK